MRRVLPADAAAAVAGDKRRGRSIDGEGVEVCDDGAGDVGGVELGERSVATLDPVERGTDGQDGGILKDGGAPPGDEGEGREDEGQDVLVDGCEEEGGLVRDEGLGGPHGGV